MLIIIIYLDSMHPGTGEIEEINIDNVRDIDIFTYAFVSFMEFTWAQ